jgi:hypothetical protein
MLPVDRTGNDPAHPRGVLVMRSSWSRMRQGALGVTFALTCASSVQFSGCLKSTARGIASDITEKAGIATLQAEPSIADRKRPQEHVIALVNHVLAEAGLPGRTLQSVQPEADGALTSGRDGPEYRRQSVRLSFQALSLTELGAFLIQWRRHAGIWTPSRIELTKHRSRADDDDRYDVTVVISAIYVADSPPS